MNKALFCLLFAIFWLFSLNAQRKKEKWPIKGEVPPGTIQIDSNFYADETEISNFYYMEYLFWLQRIYGDSSSEYLNAKPDLNVWPNDSCLSAYSYHYFGHPAYRFYPVVGINQSQAADFCKWRSDRVFELLLIREHVIEYNGDQHKNNYFSIENYFNGKYNNYRPNMNYSLYPNYKLPSLEEWQSLKTFFSLHDAKAKKKKLKNECSKIAKIDSSFLQFNVEVCADGKFKNEPTSLVYCDYSSSIGYFVIGNVSEWLDRDNLFIGGSWRDSTKTNFDTPLEFNGPTCFIGFRSVFEWKKYSKQ